MIWVSVVRLLPRRGNAVKPLLWKGRFNVYSIQNVGLKILEKWFAKRIGDLGESEGHVDAVHLHVRISTEGSGRNLGG